MVCKIGNVASDGGDGRVDEREGIVAAKIYISGGLLDIDFNSTWPKSVGSEMLSS